MNLVFSVILFQLQYQIQSKYMINLYSELFILLIRFKMLNKIIWYKQQNNDEKPFKNKI